MIKLKNILNEIITEIGDVSTVPNNAHFSVSNLDGQVTFKINDLNYVIYIRVIIKQEYNFAVAVDFKTEETEYELTNAQNPILIMGYIMASIEKWLKLYSKKYCDSQGKLIYLKFDPKSEDSENLDNSNLNKRGRVYKMYITKFAQRYNTNPQFITSGGIVAKFNPPIEIQQ